MTEQGRPYRNDYTFQYLNHPTQENHAKGRNILPLKLVLPDVVGKIFLPCRTQATVTQSQATGQLCSTF